jgi:organic radical activating enzyme
VRRSQVSEVYLVNEIHRTIHGEGVRYGIPHVFVRFAGCNQGCGFCDTEYESGREMSAVEIVVACHELLPEVLPLPDLPGGAKPRAGEDVRDWKAGRNVLFCGGEPLLQLDAELVAEFRGRGWFVAVETNGTRPAPAGIDWITCSPKVAEHAIKLERCNELKYVRGYGMGIPTPAIPADHYLISPLFEGNSLDWETMEWCIDLVKANPPWRLTVQHHKVSFGGIR